MDTSTARAIRWFYDPSVSFRLLFLELDEVGMKLVELLRQDVGVWNKVILSTAILLLCFHEVEAEPVFPGDFVRHGEMVDSLVLI